MDESQQELYQSCLMYPAMDGRQASSDEQAFIDRMEAKHPEQCRRIAQKMIGNMQAARQRALRSKTRIANENKRLAAAEQAAYYAARRPAVREEANRHNSAVVTSIFRDFVNEIHGMDVGARQASDESDAKQEQPANDTNCKADAKPAPESQAVELKRYEMVVLGSGATMQQQPRGQWVRTTDLAKLIDEAFSAACSAIDAKFGSVAQ